MEQLYDVVGISRQAFHQYLNKKEQDWQLHQLIIDKAHQIRNEKGHPRMGARSIFHHLKMCEPEFFSSVKIGENNFEKVLLNNGFRLPKVKCYRITTRGNGFRFPNFIKGLILKGIDKVWSSDITYWEVYIDHKKHFFYLTLIIDIYSRRVIGYALSKRLITEETTIPALQMCLETRGITTRQILENLIFHSDAGGQYYDANFLALLKGLEIKSSMSETAIENPYSERLNGVIKNQYLIPWNPNSEIQLPQLVFKAIWNYNHEKPHRGLKNLSPVIFEEQLLHIPESQRTPLIIKG